jgi:hypothetical protein
MQQQLSCIQLSQKGFAMRFDLKPILVAVVAITGASAHAQTVPVAQCAATGPGVVACAGVAVIVHELVQLGNGKQPFGPEGEGMKVVNGAGDILAGVFGWGGGGGGRPSSEEMQQRRLDKAPK